MTISDELRAFADRIHRATTIPRELLEGKLDGFNRASAQMHLDYYRRKIRRSR